ncbi:MAG: MFS transporter [Acidobacteriota bacterium]
MIDSRSSRVPWAVVALLVVSVAINYIDRGNLSIAAPILKDELGLSAAQLGFLLSAFFWTYALCQLLSGWLVDRFNANILLAAGYLLWSLATAATGLVHGFAALVVLRLILGAGESVAYPCYSKILASHVAEHQRGLPNALIDAGTKFGPALGTLVGGVLMARYGWRPFFIVLGLASLIWLPFWNKWMPAGMAASADAALVPTTREIISQRAAWASFTGHFCGNYFWYFLLTWLPFYLVRERHFTLPQMASVGSLAYIVTAAASVVAGWLSDRAITRGATQTRVRKMCTGGGLAGATVVVAVVMIPDRTTSMVLLMLACVSYGTFASSHWAITQTLAGPLAAGKWSGVQNFVANLSGVVAPALTGIVVDRTGQFFWAFAVSAAVVLVGAAAYVFGLSKVEPVDWTARPARAAGGIDE